MGVSVGFRMGRYDFSVALYFTVLNMLLYLVVFYINYFFIFPRYYKSIEKSKLIRMNMLVIIFFSALYVIVDYRIHLPYESMNRPGKLVALSLLRNISANFLLVSVNSVFLLQEKMLIDEKKSEIIKEEKLQAELLFLRSQINPHFLFNALNNIYSLSYLKSEKAPESILQLSHMLRYVIEDCKDEYLPLSSEIEYLENYISFQKTRSPRDLNISFDHANADGSLFISPLLFLPFVENSIKYSRIAEVDDAYVKIVLKTEKNKSIYFEIENSISEKTVASGLGTGINNAKKRLALIYPNTHSLQIDAEERVYRIYMKLLGNDD